MESVTDLGLLILGFLFGLIPENLNRKRRLRTHWSALLVETRLCAEYMGKYRTDEIAAPLYRLPIVTFQTAFPILLENGALNERESEVIAQFYNYVEQINRGLDAAASLKRADPGFEYEIFSEANRLRLKVANALDAPQDAQSLYGQVQEVIENKLKLKWWQYQNG